MDGITDSMDMCLSTLREIEKEAWHAAIHGVTVGATELLNNNWPQTAKMHMKGNDFSEPRLLHLPIQKKKC